MTDFNSATELALRQSQLRLQMKLAFEHQETRQHLILQSLWVHRYGLGTLPRFQEQEINVSDDLKIDIDHPAPLEQVVKVTDSICQDESNKLSSTCIDSSSKVENQLFEIESSIDQSLEEIKVDVDDLEKVDYLLKNADSRPKDNQVTSKSVVRPAVAPPPPRMLNHLRRWMPSITDEKYPNAS